MDERPVIQSIRLKGSCQSLLKACRRTGGKSLPRATFASASNRRISINSHLPLISVPQSLAFSISLLHPSKVLERKRWLHTWPARGQSHMLRLPPLRCVLTSPTDQLGLALLFKCQRPLEQRRRSRLRLVGAVMLAVAVGAAAVPVDLDRPPVLVKQEIFGEDRLNRLCFGVLPVPA